MDESFLSRGRIASEQRSSQIVWAPRNPEFASLDCLSHNAALAQLVEQFTRNE